MSKKKEFTGTLPQHGNKRSKSLNATKKQWNPNYQTITVEVDGKKRKIRLTAKEIRTLKKEI